jgi:hypothetical protein
MAEQAPGIAFAAVRHLVFVYLWLQDIDGCGERAGLIIYMRNMYVRAQLLLCGCHAPLSGQTKSFVLSYPSTKKTKASG